MPSQPDAPVWVGPRSGLHFHHITVDLAADLGRLERESFPTADAGDLYDADDFVVLAREFPEGCFVGLDGDEAVAMGVGIRFAFDLNNPQHTIHDVFPDDGSSGHDRSGEWYYGTSIAVRPTHRKRGIGNELYELRKQVCRDLELRGIVAGGVIPGYERHKRTMSADAYIDAVVAGELYDPTLSFQLENGFEAGPALHNYIIDPEVDNYAALIVWHNRDD